jgi:hypothetical protein
MIPNSNSSASSRPQLPGRTLFWAHFQRRGIQTGIQSHAVLVSAVSGLTVDSTGSVGSADYFTKYYDLAERLDLVPWEVLQACRQLARRGLAESGKRERHDEFRRKNQYE